MVYKFTARAEKALEIANELALELGHNYIGTEHIFYGLAAEGTGVASKVLENQNVTDEAILQDVQEHIKRTKNKLDAENLRLANALQAQDQHRIFQAKLAYKIAEIEYIAARQEELRLKDLLKPIPKK